MIHEIDEVFQKANAPVYLFDSLDGPVRVKLLPIGDSEAWALKTREIESLEDRLSYLTKRIELARLARDLDSMDLDSAQTEWIVELTAKIRESQERTLALTRALLQEYAPAVFTDELFTKATAAQIVGAYRKLKAYSDPFIVQQALQHLWLENRLANAVASEKAKR